MALCPCLRPLPSALHPSHLCRYTFTPACSCMFLHGCPAPPVTIRLPRTDHHHTNHTRYRTTITMSLRFMSRMASKNAMQLEWQRHHSSPPSYEQQSDSTPISPISPASEQPPTYQRASRSCSAPPVYIQRQISNTDTIIDLYSFPPRSTILVVGAYTRQGMHIIDRLIENGHLVRGIVSNAREAAQVSKHFEASHGRGYYHSSIVTDMTVEGSLDSTARDCSGVVFVTSQSSPVMNSAEARVANVINALTSAVKQAKMDRFIYCSSPPATRPSNVISTIDEEEDDEPVSRNSATQPPRPSQWLSRSSHEESITEETPIEIAMGKWIDLWEPKFALQTGKFTPKSQHNNFSPRTIR
jgi:hypothetical protein